MRCRRTARDVEEQYHSRASEMETMKQMYEIQLQEQTKILQGREQAARRSENEKLKAQVAEIEELKRLLQERRQQHAIAVELQERKWDAKSSQTLPK